jgi:DNA modification methylase
LGLEPTIELYVEHLVEIFREVRRVLRKDGTLWLNLGDSYYGGGGAHKGHHANPGLSKSSSRGGVPKGRGERLSGKALTCINGPNRFHQAGLKPKDLCMIPARVALALQADGWWLRSQIIWSKPNPMPESTTDRPTTAHEYIFLLTKSARYFYDAEAVREGITGNAHPGRKDEELSPRYGKNDMRGMNQRAGTWKQNYLPSSRNCRSVWEIATSPFPEAHFATFPPTLPERCIKAGTSEKGCCPKCGAPWVRVVEKKASTMNIRVRDAKKGILEHKTPGFEATEAEIANYGKEEMDLSTTLGWRPGCKCEGAGKYTQADPHPQAEEL